MRVLLLLTLALLACGRTKPVHYSSDGGLEFGTGDSTTGEDGTTEDMRPRNEDGGIACVDGESGLLTARPVVMLVLDRSSSMRQDFPGTSRTKWGGLRTALHGALPPWSSTMELGAIFFPSAAQGGCSVGGTVDFAPALNNVPAILDKLDRLAPEGSTPTAIALERAGAVLAARRTASSARALVLATDGAPDCNAGLDPRTCSCAGPTPCLDFHCLDDVRTLERLHTLADSGIPTWIIGLRGPSDLVFFDVLNRMADAGGKPQANSFQRFYSASSPAELQSALGIIREQVGTCRYLTPSVPDQGGSIELTLDGAVVPFDTTKGWSWIDLGNGELELKGEACERAQTLPLDALKVVVQCAP